MINTGISFVLECITRHRISNIMLVYLFSLSYGDLRPILYEECNDINMNSIWFSHTANLSCALQYITGNYHISYTGSLFFFKNHLKDKISDSCTCSGGTGWLWSFSAQRTHKANSINVKIRGWKTNVSLQWQQKQWLTGAAAGRFRSRLRAAALGATNTPLCLWFIGRG